MYSQCPTCKAIFSVSEADLAARRGLVRCGYCSGVFNARTNEVDGIRAKPDDVADEATGEAAAPAGEHAGAGRAEPYRAPDEEDVAGRSHEYQDRAGVGTDRSSGVEEDHGWKVSGPGPDDQAPDYIDRPLIEPELPGARPVAEQVQEKPPEESGSEPTTPEPTTPGPTTPGPTDRDEAVPEASAPENASQDDTPMGEPASREPVRPEATSDSAGPGEALRSQAPAEEPALREPVQQEAEPEEPIPEEPTPEEPTPEEPTPEESTPEESTRGAPPVADETYLPGEITEEITIEAPPVLWNAFDEDTEERVGRHASKDDDADRDATTPGATEGRGEPASGVRGSLAGQAAPGAAGGRRGRRAPLRSPYGDPDIAMVELPQPKPFKTATLSLLTVLLALLLVWQVKSFYLDDLAQVPALRPYLESLCRPLGCVLPPRRDFARIDLVGTSIDVNPEYPGALEIQASLINRAGFPQPYPSLRVTLTDREGRVVGRRTYLPSEYRAGEGERLPVRAVRNVSINLAQPAENAVGYEVELMAPLTGGEG